MDKIYSLLAKFIGLFPDTKLMPRDKIAHFVGGALGVLPFMFFHMEVIGLAVITVLAAAKEIIDWLRNRRLQKQGLQPTHGVEVFDFVATVLGAGAVVLAGALVKALQFLPLN